MKVAVRIFLIFALLFVLAGAGCMGAGIILGGSFEEVSAIGGEIPLNFWKHSTVQRMIEFPFIRRASEKRAEETEDMAGDIVGYTEVDNLYIDVAAGSVEIVTGDEEKILVEYSSESAEVELEDGTLTVRDDWTGWFADIPVTKVMIPADYAFKKVTLKGTGSITCGDLTADSVLITADAADICVDGRLQAREKLEVKANAADVTIERAAWVPTALLTSNAGDIDVVFEGNRSDYAITAESNLGDISVEDGDASEGTGKNPAGQIQAKSNVGDIDIDFEKIGGKKYVRRKRLRRSRNGMICGVCGGIAEYFVIDPTLVRLGWVIFSAMGGSGILAYVVAAIIMPPAD